MSTKYNFLRSMTTRTRSAFSLIELMIVVAIIGILAAIAIPAYNDYTIRSKVTEMLNAAGTAKTAISEYYISRGSFPADLATSGASSAATNYVSSLAFVPGPPAVLTVTSTKTKLGIAGTAGNVTIDFTAVGDPANGVTWTCAVGGATPIDSKYLPSQCR